MGTSVAITVVHPDIGEAKEAVGLAFDEIHKIDDLTSLYNEKSEVSTLNRDGSHKATSTDLIEVIRRGRYFSELSDGAFDVTVLPVLDLWKERLSEGKVPTSSEIGRTLELVDYRDIAIEGRDITLKKEGMA